MNVVLNLLVIAATVLGAGMAFPQVRRIVRTRQVDGVSTIWIGVSVGLNAWWLAYGLAAPVWALVPVSAASLTMYSVMAFGYLRAVGGGGRRSAWRGMLTGAFGLGMIPLPFLLIGGWALAGIVVGLCYGIQLLPAVVAVCRTSALAGVSAATWLIALVESAIWFVYGMGVGDDALLLAGAVGAVMASVILVRLAVTGHRPLATFVGRAPQVDNRTIVTSLNAT